MKNQKKAQLNTSLHDKVAYTIEHMIRGIRVEHRSLPGKRFLHLEIVKPFHNSEALYCIMSIFFRCPNSIRNQTLKTLPPPLIQHTVTATTLNTRQRTIPAMAICEKGEN